MKEKISEQMIYIIQQEVQHIVLRRDHTLLTEKLPKRRDFVLFLKVTNQQLQLMNDTIHNLKEKYILGGGSYFFRSISSM